MKNLIFIMNLVVVMISGSIYAEIKGTDASPINEYKIFLETLNKKEKESVLVAKEKFINIFGKDKKFAEDGFRIFREFYSDVVREIDNEFFKKKEYQDFLHEIMNEITKNTKNISVISHYADKKDEYLVDLNITYPLEAFEKVKTVKADKIRNEQSKIMKELYKYRDCGVNFMWGEGDWYLVEDNSFLVNKVLKGFDIKIKYYMEFLSKEDGERLAEDAGLCITWDQLRQRIIRHEKFLNEYQDFPEAKTEVESALKRLITFYIGGIDNSRVYDWDTKKLIDDLKKSYETFIKENKNSRYYSLIKDCYKKLEKNDFIINRDYINFVKSQGVEWFTGENGEWK